MAQFFDGPTTRLQTIISGGWGVGSADPTIANRAIPAGRWLATPDQSPVEDFIFSGSRFDRAYVVNWLGERDFPEPNDPFQNTLIVRARCQIDIGYVYGYPNQMDAQVNVDAGTSETPASALASVRSRALSDARRIWRALNLTTLLANTGTDDVDPILVGVTQVDEAVTVDLGKGRLLLHIPLLVDIQGDANTAYDP